MMLYHHPGKDRPYIEFGSRLGAQVREMADGLNVNVEVAGEAMGFDICDAAKRPDRSTPATIALLFKTTREA